EERLALGERDSKEAGITLLPDSIPVGDCLLGALWNNLPQGATLIDQSFRLIQRNEVFRRQSSLEIGENFFERIENSRKSLLLKDQIERVFSGGEKISTTEICYESGEVGHRTAHHFPLLGASGEVKWILSLWQESTPPGEGAVQHESFASILSHELRTPLNFIMGFASLLDEEIPGPLNPEQHGFVDKVLDGSERMASVIENLLDCAQGTQKALNLLPASLKETYELCREAIEDCQRQLLAKSQEISLMVAPSLPPVLFDAVALKRALVLLLDNAVKFSPSSERIRVSVEAAGEAMLIKVRDCGDGIPSEKIHRIFDPFYQADMSTTRIVGGMGIGLCLVSRIVAGHLGSLGAETSSDGALFWVSIPSSSY
ncbi:MAG TPA: HAMP domain-containing sensor histidine kinase, partial [Chroococcales cyanobacterium]